MNRNIESLLMACKNLGVEYNFYHTTKNLVGVMVAGREWLFSNWTTPLNYQSVVQLCQDKDYFYNYYKDIVRMPKSMAFLNPYGDAKYKRYLKQRSIYEIIESVEMSLEYPLIVKKNRGSWGTNVFKVESRRELEQALLAIFNTNSASFDYVALVQEFIEIDKEFRAIFLDGEFIFAYEKIVDGAAFKDNLSPLHWEGSRAVFVTDSQTIEAIKWLCKPMFKKLEIAFSGLDIAKSRSGEYILIEANSSPGFDHIIKHQGYKQVVGLYEQILKRLGA